MGQYLDVNEFLAKNKLTDKEMDGIVRETAKSNWKVAKILEAKKHWSDIGVYQLQLIVDWHRKEKEAGNI